MFPLLCRSALQGQTCYLNSTARVVATVSRAHYSSTTNPEWTPTRQYANKITEERARRRATDPEYRERLVAQQRESRAKNKRAWYDYQREYAAQNIDKIRASVAAQKASRDFEKLYYAPLRARWASDDQFRQRESLRTWLVKKPWVQDLTWRTHKPVISEKVIRYCGGCEATRSLKLWWQDKKTDEFLCHPCFASDWSRALPIGYEDKVFGLKRYRSTKSTTVDNQCPDA